MHKRQQPGFTLIELMITVAIIAILASIAFPSYESSMRKSRRATAQAFMMDAAAREQQVFLDSRGYVAVANNAAFQAALNIGVPTDVSSFYDLSVTLVAGPPPGFTLTATAKNKQLPDGNLTISNTGVKTPADKW